MKKGRRRLLMLSCVTGVTLNPTQKLPTLGKKVTKNREKLNIAFIRRNYALLRVLAHLDHWGLALFLPDQKTDTGLMLQICHHHK
jgi:hypothetical protein